MIKIESEVPFGRALHDWLYLHDLHLDQLVRHDQMERHYLAWESVRKQLNPYFQEGTGFEGYLIGRCLEPQAALDAILAINQHILDALLRLYRFQPGFRSSMMKTLLREKNDLAAIHLWSAYLGAELGKLRAQVMLNDRAVNFQQRTYQLIRALPPIVYEESADDVLQRYVVGASDAAQPEKLLINGQLLKPSQQDAWLVAQNIGEFGHPLVRTLLDRG